MFRLKFSSLVASSPPSCPAASASVAIISCCRLFSADWRERVRNKVVQDRERAKLEKKIPTRVVEAGDDGGETGYVVSHDLSPTKIDEMVQRRMQGIEEDDDDAVSGNTQEQQQQENDDGEPTIASHDEAQEAFEHRRQLSERMAEKRSVRREDKARWLMWQAAQREKGFERRVRRKIEKQRAMQRARFSQMDGRMLTVGAGSASDFVRHRTLDEEQDHAVTVDSIDQRRPEQKSSGLDDSELDDLLSVQDTAKWDRVRGDILRGARTGDKQQITAAEKWGDSREYHHRARTNL